MSDDSAQRDGGCVPNSTLGAGSAGGAPRRPRHTPRRQVRACAGITRTRCRCALRLASLAQGCRKGGGLIVTPPFLHSRARFDELAAAEPPSASLRRSRRPTRLQPRAKASGEPAARAARSGARAHLQTRRLRRRRRGAPATRACGSSARAVGPRYTPAAFSAASTRAALNGTRRRRTPVASYTALATAASVGLHTVSPAP